MSDLRDMSELGHLIQNRISRTHGPSRGIVSSLFVALTNHASELGAHSMLAILEKADRRISGAGAG